MSPTGGELKIDVTADTRRAEQQVRDGMNRAGRAAEASLAAGMAGGMGAAAGKQGRLAGLAYSAAYGKAANALMSDTAKRVGQRMTLGVTAPLVLLGAQSVKVAAAFESNLSRVGFVLKAPADQMERLKDLALTLGKETQFSAQEASSSMLELAKSGFTTEQIMGGVLEQVLNVAAAGSLDLTNAANVMGAAMNSFGLEAEDAVNVSDALAGAANASATDVQGIADALQNVASVAGGLAGQELPEVTGTLAALAKDGIAGAEAGTTLKSAMVALVKPTSQAQSVMKEYGIEAYNAQGEMKPLSKIAGELETAFKGVDQETRNAALATIFGSYGIKAATTLYKQGEDGINGYVEASERAGYAQEAAAAELGDTERALINLSGSWETLQVAVGESLTPIVGALARGLTTLTNVFTNLPSGVRTAAVGFGVFLAAIGPVMWALRTVIGSIRTLLGFRFGKMAAGIGAAKAAACAPCAGGLPGKAGKLAPIANGGKLAAAMAGLVSFLSSPLTVAAITVASLAVQVMKVANSDRPGTEVSPQQIQPGSPTGNQAGLGPQVSAGNREADEARRAAENAAALAEAERKYGAALQATNAIVQQRNQGTLRGTQLTTQAKGALQQYVNESRGLTETLVRQKAPAQEVANQALAQRSAFMQQAVAMGFSKQEAALLARSMDLIPDEVQTYIKTAGAEEAAAETAKIDERLAKLRQRKTQIQVEGKGDKESRAELEKIDKRMDGLKRKKARIEVEASALDKVANKLDKFPGKIKNLSDDEIRIAADASDADATMKQTESDLEALQKAPWKPKVTVQSNAADVARAANASLDGISDELVYITYIERRVQAGGGGGGGGTPETEQPSLFRAWRSGRDVVSGGGVIGTMSALGGTVFGGRRKAADRPPYGAFAGLGADFWNELRREYGSEYEALGELAAASFGDALDDKLRREQDRIQGKERKRQRRREDEDLEWQRARQRRSNQLARKAEDLKGEAKRKANERARKFDRKTEDLSIKRQRANEDEDRKINKKIERRRRNQERERRDAAIQQRKEEAFIAELVRLAEQRAAQEEQITRSVYAQYEARSKQLRASAQFTTSPTSTLRRIQRQTDLLNGLGSDLEALRAEGLSPDVIAQLLQMDPKDAAKLAKRLAADPSLVQQMNNAYGGLSKAAAKVAAEDTRTEWQGVGTGIVDGIVNGLAGGEQGLLTYLQSLSQDMLDVVKKQLGIGSPSREFAGIGRDAGAGMLVGLTGMERKVAAASQRLATIPAGSVRGGDGAAMPGMAITVNPSAGMDERQLAAQIGREVSWRL